MPGLPEPQVGLVISYAYLWFAESQRGRVEGTKDRPCAIVLAVERPGSGARRGRQVAVAPITHSVPTNPRAAVEIPPRAKEYLRLDSERSWVVLNEFNVFTWPGYDLRSIPKLGGRVEYGFLPPRFVDRLIARFGELADQERLSWVSRDESERSRHGAC